MIKIVGKKKLQFIEHLWGTIVPKKNLIIIIFRWVHTNYLTFPLTIFSIFVIVDAMRKEMLQHNLISRIMKFIHIACAKYEFHERENSSCILFGQVPIFMFWVSQINDIIANASKIRKVITNYLNLKKFGRRKRQLFRNTLLILNGKREVKKNLLFFYITGSDTVYFCIQWKFLMDMSSI